LQGILPELAIEDIYFPHKQEEINDPEHYSQKDVRLDILVEDYNHNLYNIGVQTTNTDDIARRMRYYAAKADQRYTLKKGSTYRSLKNVYIIFLCTFTQTEKTPIRNKYLTINSNDQTDVLQDGLTKIIINSNGIPNGDETKTLLNLVKLMKNLPVSGDTYFDIAQNRIKEINSDEKWRDMIMDYETKLLEREQDAEEKGLKRGIEKGIQQGIEQGILQGKKEGKEKERITGIKKLIGALKDFGGTDQQILERLEQDYGDSFSKEQLEEFLREG
jgi:predicted transposase/invertase (TIGR01784 family)